MKKTLCIIQGRMSSTRFLGKTLKEIAGHPMLYYVVSRALKAKKIEKLVVATSDQTSDNVIADFCKNKEIDCFRGSLDDVLHRFYTCSQNYPEYDVIVRVTADCPLIDPEVISKVILKFEETKADYASNILKETYPDGIDVEVFTKKSLEEAHQNAKLSSEREHVTLYMRNNPKYKKVNVENDENISHFRLSVDNREDFEVISFLVEKYGAGLGFKEYCNILRAHPEIMSKNAKIERNEGLKKSLKEDKEM